MPAVSFGRDFFRKDHVYFCLIRVFREQLDESREGDWPVLPEKGDFAWQTCCLRNFFDLTCLAFTETLSKLESILTRVNEREEELLHILISNNKEPRQAFLCDYKCTTFLTEYKEKLDNSLLAVVVAKNDRSAQP